MLFFTTVASGLYCCSFWHLASHNLIRVKQNWFGGEMNLFGSFSLLNTGPGRLVIVGVLFVLGLANTAHAHHSFAMFDREVTETISGTVTKFEFTNPHAWIWVDVENEDGTITNWGFELSSAPGLARQGWKPKSVVAGDKITVSYNPMKNGDPAGAFKSAVFENGEPVGPKR